MRKLDVVWIAVPEALLVLFGGLTYLSDVRGGGSVEFLNPLVYRVFHEITGQAGVTPVPTPPTLNLLALSILLVVALNVFIVASAYLGKKGEKGGAAAAQ